MRKRYLHGDYLQAEDRNATSTVYCGFCDGFCLPEHLYEEHPIDESVLRLNATKKAYYRNKHGAARPEGAPNYFDGASDPSAGTTR